MRICNLPAHEGLEFSGTRAKWNGLRIRAAIALLALLAVLPVLAEPPDQEQLQEIVVTATKRAEPLQDVPFAVSALTGETLEAMGATSFTDYARTIPSLTFTDLGNGRERPSIRGLNSTIGADTVGYYIGETPLTSVSGLNVGQGALVNPYLIDLNRIEVLRGPQGTLYGSGSIGGTIRLIPNLPDLTQFGGSIQATTTVTQGKDGASPGGELDLVVNAPIATGTAGVRGVFWGRDVGGFINRTYGYTGDFPPGTPHPTGTVGNIPNEQTWGFRGIALFEPFDKLKIEAMAYLQHQHFDGFQDITGGATNPDNQLFQNLILNNEEPQNNNFYLYNITVDYQFGRLDFISSTSYYEDTQDEQMEGTSLLQLAFGGPPVPGNLEYSGTDHNFTEEARLATSERIYGFDAVGGVFYSKTQSPSWVQWAPPQWNSLMNANDPTSPLYAPENLLYHFDGQFNQRQTAVFGELTYHLTNSLSATGGLRHYDISNDNSETSSGYFISPGEIVPQSSSWSATSVGTIYKGNLSYNLSPDHLVYFQYSEGFRPGFGQHLTPTPICPTPNAPTVVDPDSIRNYEFGAKTEWLNKRLTLNAAVYRINWSQIQQSVIIAQCGATYVTNSGDAVIKGAELEVNGRITSRMSAGLSGAYISAKLQQDEPVIGAMAGDQIEQVPNWQYAVYWENTFPTGDRADAFLRLDYQYTGASWGAYNRLADGTRDPTYEIDQLRLLNLRTGLRARGWELSLTGTNLLNEIGRQSVDPWSFLTAAIPGRPRYVVNRPRTIGLNARYEF